MLLIIGYVLFGGSGGVLFGQALFLDSEVKERRQRLDEDPVEHEDCWQVRPQVLLRKKLTHTNVVGRKVFTWNSFGHARVVGDTKHRMQYVCAIKTCHASVLAFAPASKDSLAISRQLLPHGKSLHDLCGLTTFLHASKSRNPCRSALIDSACSSRSPWLLRCLRPGFSSTA